jgi:hypothetical protein
VTILRRGSDPPHNHAPALTAAALLLAGLAGCSPGTSRLDEAPIHVGAQFQIKLVRYYENLPLHYTGEVFRVQCASENTRGSPGHKTQDAGWVTLSGGGAIGSNSAAELAARERTRLIVFDDRALAWVGSGVSVSFDACGTVRSWYPTSLPQELIVPAPKPDFCAQEKVDCRHFDFVGHREPRFEPVQATPDGHVSFVVRSKAFRRAEALRVQSDDFGQSWRVERD